MAEVRADIELLLECLRCQQDCPSSMKQALLALASMCSTTKASKDMLRECGGLKYVFDLMVSTRNTELKQASMFMIGCAVELNPHSQKMLSTSGMYLFLGSCLSATRAPLIQKQMAIFLLICLVANNSVGQMQVRKSNCLPLLLDLFKSSLVSPEHAVEGSSWFDGLEGRSTSLKLWSTVTSALGVCVNNPQNDENQRVCTSVFPHSFNLLHENPETLEIVQPICSFISLSVAGNVHNQARVSKCGGLQALLDVLHRSVNRIHDDPNSPQLTIALNIITTLDHIVTDHGENAKQCGALGLIALLLELLKKPCLDEEAQMQVVVTLGHSVDACPLNQSQLVESGALSVLIPLIGVTDNDELVRATKYVLQSCVIAGEQSNFRKPVPFEDRVSAFSDNSTFKNVATYPERGENNAMPLTQKINKSNRSLGIIDEENVSGRGTNPSQAVTYGRKEFNVWLKHQKSGHIEGAVLPAAPTKPDEIQKKLEDLESMLKQSLCGQKEMQERLEKDKKEEIKSAQERSAQESKDLRSQLSQERAIRKQLEQEAATAFQALAARKQEEHQAAERTKALAVELERQVPLEDGQETVLHCQIKQTRMEHQKLLEIQRKKEVELEHIQAKLNALQECDQNDIENSSSKTKGVSSKHVEGAKTHCGGGYDLRKEDVKRKLFTNNLNIDSSDATLVLSKDITVSSGVGPNYCPNEGHGDNMKTYLQKSTDIKETGTSDRIRCTYKESGVQTPKDISAITRAVQPGSQKRKGVKHTPIHKGYGDPELSKDCHAIMDNLQAQSSKPGAGGDAFSSANKSHSLHSPVTAVLSESGYLSHDDIPYTGVDSVPQNTLMSVERTTPVQNKIDTQIPSVSRIQNHQMLSSMRCNTVGIDAINPGHISADRKDLTPVKVFGKVKNADVFVKPIAPASVKRASSVYPRNTFARTPQKPKSTPLVNARSHLENVEKVTPVKPVCASPSLSMYSEFDSGLLKHARSKAPPRTQSSNGACKVRHWLEHQNVCSPVGPEACELEQGGNEDAIEVCDVIEPEADTLSGISTASCATEPLNNALCPGCQPPSAIQGPVLNSRTYNIAIETSHGTCKMHRAIREGERRLISAIKKTASAGPSHTSKLALNEEFLKVGSASSPDIYEFHSDLSNEISPVYQSPSSDGSLDTSVSKRIKRRRTRVPYTEQEVMNLTEGVEKMGRFWNQILITYEFHPSRTSVDLKDKYRQMTSRNTKRSPGSSTTSTRKLPFSMAEERRLKRGVRKFGYSWKTILSSMKFAKGRTREQLRNKWRSLHKS